MRWHGMAYTQKGGGQVGGSWLVKKDGDVMQHLSSSIIRIWCFLSRPRVREWEQEREAFSPNANERTASKRPSPLLSLDMLTCTAAEKQAVSVVKTITGPLPLPDLETTRETTVQLFVQRRQTFTTHPTAPAPQKNQHPNYTSCPRAPSLPVLLPYTYFVDYIYQSNTNTPPTHLL